MRIIDQLKLTIMDYKTKVAIKKSTADLGRPDDYNRNQLDLVKEMIREIAEGSMGGMKNIVKKGDKVLIKINTVVPSPPGNGFTTDPRVLEALVELVQEQQPSQVLIGERSALGLNTLESMEACGISEVAHRTGAELCPFDDVPFDMYRIDRPVHFNEFPVPRPVKDADVYIGVPKMKVHIHTGITNAMKLQFGNLPDYDWMTRNHSDDIFQKIANLTRAAEPDWFIVDSLYACQGNGPFSAYPEDLIKDFNTLYGGSDPVAVDTVCEALMDWDNPGSAPSTVMGASEGLGTNRLEEIEIVGDPIAMCKRKFRHQDTVLAGKFRNVNIFGAAACEPGCRVLVRMALDALHVGGTLDQLKRPLNIFVGVQNEPHLRQVEGDVIVYGDCAKKMLEYYPDAKYYGSNSKHPNCAPIWSNIPGIGLVDHVKSLT